MLVVARVRAIPGQTHYSGDADMNLVVDSLEPHVGSRTGVDIAAAGEFVPATRLASRALAGAKQRRDLPQDVLSWQG